MSITNNVIRTNKVTAGKADIGTLNSASLRIKSGSLNITTLTTNTITSNNINVSGELTGSTITSIQEDLSNYENDISINSLRINDLSDSVDDNANAIQDLSTELVSLRSDISGLSSSDLQDVSSRVNTNTEDISDLSGRMGTEGVSRTEFVDLSSSVSGNTDMILSISGRLESLDGFVSEARFQDLSSVVQDNSENIVDLCGAVKDLIGSVGGGGGITNDEFLDLSNRVAGLETDVSNLLGISADVFDLSGRITLQEGLIVDISSDIQDVSDRVTDISNDLTDIRSSYIVKDTRVGIRVDPSNTEFIVRYTLSDGTVDTSDQADIVVGLSSDSVVINGNTTFRGQVQFQGVTSVPARTTLIDTSGLTNIDFMSTTPYSHTEYIMFDTSALHAQTYYNTSINPHSSEIHLRFSKLSQSRNVFISCPPAVAKRIVFSLYDDDDLSESTIVRQQGNIIVQPGAVPIGFNGDTGTVTSSNAATLQDYSSDPYRYLYDLCDNRGNTGRFFYNHATVVPLDDVSKNVGVDHPNATGNRMDISFYPDISSAVDMSNLAITERYHRYYQTGSYQFNIEYVSTGLSSLRNTAHLYVRETSRTRPLRYAERTNSNVAISQSSEAELQLLLARLLFLSQDNFNTTIPIFNSYLDGLNPPELGEGGGPDPP